MFCDDVKGYLAVDHVVNSQFQYGMTFGTCKRRWAYYSWFLYARYHFTALQERKTSHGEKVQRRTEGL